MSMSPDNSELARRMARLWMEAQPSVLSFICAAIPRFHDAEDVLQETAIEAAANFAKYDASRPFVAWAIGIARFKIAAFYRTAQRDGSLLNERVLQQVADAHVAHHARIDDRRAALDECLGELGSAARSLIEAKYTEGAPAAELAARTGSTAGSVRVKLTRIRSRLLDCVRSKLAGGGAS
jgi:RNA polymerase sigma-70 factor (ECF subfamily)